MERKTEWARARDRARKKHGRRKIFHKVMRLLLFGSLSLCLCVWCSISIARNRYVYVLYGVLHELLSGPYICTASSCTAERLHFIRALLECWLTARNTRTTTSNSDRATFDTQPQRYTVPNRGKYMHVKVRACEWVWYDKKEYTAHKAFFFLVRYVCDVSRLSYHVGRIVPLCCILCRHSRRYKNNV